MKLGMQRRHIKRAIELEGKMYEAVQNYQGNGDPNWIYALSLWKTV